MAAVLAVLLSLLGLVIFGYVCEAIQGYMTISELIIQLIALLIEIIISIVSAIGGTLLILKLLGII